MKLNYQQMVDIFGLTYQHRGNLIEEKFELSREFNLHNTLEQAIVSAKDEIRQEIKSEIAYFDGLQQQFNDLPFFEKLGWQIKNKSLEFNSEERKKVAVDALNYQLNNIQVQMLDQSKIYNVNSPVILKSGDTLYVAVTDQNVLSIGVYKARVESADYINRHGAIDLNARLTVEDEVKKHVFNFSSDAQGFKSGHTYHHIFTDKESAIEFHNQNILEKLEDMQQKIIQLDRKPKI